MIQLANVSTGKPENVDEGDVPQLLAAGTHKPTDNAKALVNPDGSLSIIPVDQLAMALQSGYKLPTKDQLTFFSRQAKYDTPLGGAKAFGLGALRGGTFGTSDVVGNALSDDYAETASGLKEFNPGLSTAGEITGAVGSALIAPELSPAGLVGKLGAGVAERLAPEGAGALARIGARVAGGAAEGAIYGGSNSVTEAALGDPRDAAEHLVANIGMGALLGGSLGGAFKTAEIVAPKAVTAAQDTLGNVWQKLYGSTAEGAESVGAIPKIHAALTEKLTGTPAEETLAAWRARAKGVKEFEEYEKGFVKDLQAVHDKVEEATWEVNKARPVEKLELLKNMDPAQSAIETSKVSNSIEEKANLMRKHSSSMADEMSEISKELDESLTKPEATAGDHYLALDNAKKRLYDLRKPRMSYAEDKAAKLAGEAYQDIQGQLTNSDIWGDAAARQSAYNDAVHDYVKNTLPELRSQFFTKAKNGDYSVNPSKVRNFLNNVQNAKGDVKAEALSNYFTSADSLLKEVDETYKSTPFEGYDKEAMDRLIQKSLKNTDDAYNIVKAQPGKGHGGIQNILSNYIPSLGVGGVKDTINLALAGHFLGGPGVAAVGAAKAIGTALNPGKIAMIESAAAKSRKLIDKGMSAVFSNDVGQKAVGILAKKLSPQERNDDVKDKIKEVQDHMADVPGLIDKLSAATSPIYNDAPNTMQATQEVATRALQFLSSKIPQTPPSTPFEKPLDPPQGQLEAFNNYYETVHDPLSVIDELKSGMLKPESKEALAAVYPRLYMGMQQAAVERLSKFKDVSTIPFKTRQMMSQFMGQPADSLLTPFAVNNAQTLGHAAAQKEDQKGSVKPTSKGVQKLNFAGRMTTDFQKTLKDS